MSFAVVGLEEQQWPMSIGGHVDQVYVIHSPRLRERREHLALALEKHSIEATWIESFESHQIGLGLLIRRVRKTSLRRAEISVYLKQEAVYRDMVARAVDVALVLEDDAILEEDFSQRFGEYLHHLPADFDLVFFGESCGARLPATDNAYFARSPWCRSASGYLITGCCAQILCEHLRRIDAPIDIKLGLLIGAQGLNCYWSEPPLVGNGSERGIFEHSLGVRWRQR